MKKNIFAICDTETAYVYSLMECIHARQSAEFEVQAFTNVKALLEYVKDHEIEMLLIASSVMCEKIKQEKIEKIMILSEGEHVAELSEYPMVYKYQAVDVLIREVMDCYARVKKPSRMSPFKKEVEIVGFYSPLGQSEKTTFALTYGQIRSRHKNVLYLNLEEYAGFEQLFGKEFEADITDFMYFAGQGEGNLMCKMVGLVQDFHNLDYIPPAFSAYDLRSISAQEWISMLNYLCTYSTYEVILLDLGNAVDNLPEILRHCGRIYMPAAEDTVSAAKLGQYEKAMRTGNYEDVIEKTKKLLLPPAEEAKEGEDYGKQFAWGKMGDLARKLIQEEKDEHAGR